MASPSSSKRLIKKSDGKRNAPGRSKKLRATASGRSPMKGMVIASATPRGGNVAVIDTKRRIFGGELIISGDMDDRKRAEIMGTIKNIVTGAIGRTAKKAQVRMEKGRIVVRTAESQPAVALGKKLHRAHKGGRLTITWGGLRCTGSRALEHRRIGLISKILFARMIKNVGIKSWNARHDTSGIAPHVPRFSAQHFCHPGRKVFSR